MTLRLIQPVPLPGIRPELLVAVDDPDHAAWSVVAERIERDLPQPKSRPIPKRIRHFVADYQIVYQAKTDQYCLVRNLDDVAHIDTGRHRLPIPVLWVSSPHDTRAACVAMLEQIVEKEFPHG